jgi:hypothetical protein
LSPDDCFPGDYSAEVVQADSAALRADDHSFPAAA